MKNVKLIVITKLSVSHLLFRINFEKTDTGGSNFLTISWIEVKVFSKITPAILFWNFPLTNPSTATAPPKDLPWANILFWLMSFLEKIYLYIA